ncbi:MAG: hypothetical protein ACREQY_01325, partial [Candidatus Binatia bacterium]
MSSRYAIHGAITLGALLLAYSDLLGGSRIPIYRDLLPFVYPYRWFLGEHVSQGNLPLWNPWVQLGVPFLASLHASVLYPPSLLLVVAFPFGFNLFLLIHYLLAADGMARLLRDRGLAGAPVAVGAVVFAVGGYLASSLTNTAHLQTAVWIPWTLLAWERYARRRGGGALLATVLLLAVQLCAGAPEVWLLTVALLALRSLSGQTPGVWSRLVLAGRLGVAVAFAVLLAAVQLLPTLEYVSESRRLVELDWAEVTYWSLEPVSLLQLLFPHSSALVGAAEAGTVGTYLETTPPLVHSLYLGMFGLVLAIVGAATSRDRSLWGGVAILTVLFALGPGSPVFDLARTTVPVVVGRIRYPEKVLVLFHLAVAILAADGAAAILGKLRGAIR